MAHTRSTEPKSDFPAWKQALLPVTTAVVTGTAIAVVLYPIEYLQTRIQVGLLKTRMSSAFFLANYKMMFTGLYKSMQASWVKNGVISQKDTVHENIHDVMNERESITIHEQRLIATFATAGVIGFCDTTFTQYLRNYRIKNAMGATPSIDTWTQMINFSKNGYVLSLSRNFLNAFFCISAKTILEPMVNQTVPSHQHPVVNLFTTNIIAGSLSGLITTPLDIIAKRRVHAADPVTHQAPSAWKIFKNLYKAEGIRPFFKGSGLNMAMSVIVFAMINGIEFEKYARILLRMDLSEGKTPKGSPTLFQPAEQSSPKIEEIIEENKAQVSQRVRQRN